MLKALLTTRGDIGNKTLLIRIIWDYWTRFTAKLQEDNFLKKTKNSSPKVGSPGAKGCPNNMIPKKWINCQPTNFYSSIFSESSSWNSSSSSLWDRASPKSSGRFRCFCISFRCFLIIVFVSYEELDLLRMHLRFWIICIVVGIWISPSMKALTRFS